MARLHREHLPRLRPPDVEIGFTNNYTARSCDRNLRVDKVSFVSSSTSPAPGSPGPVFGANRAGGEFGALPGTYGRDYTYPTAQELDYYKSKEEVRNWIGAHNRAVKRGYKEGVRIVDCLFLPKQSPWLNPIEPKWVHGKRRVVDADGLLTAQDLAERVRGFRLRALQAPVPRRKYHLIMR